MRPCFERFLAAQEVAWHRRDRGVIGPPETPPHDIAKIRRTNITQRIDTLRGIPGGLERLAQVWPVNIPTLKQSDGHTADQLAVLGYLLTEVEREFEAPFNPPPITPGPTLVDNDPVVARTDINDQAPKVRHEQLITRIDTLPGGWTAPIDAAATIHKIPNLYRGKATNRQLDQLEELVTAVEQYNTDAEACSELVLRDATEGDEELSRAIRSCAMWDGTPHGHQRLQAVAHAVSHTDLVLVAQDTGGWTVEPSQQLVDALVSAAGSKTAVNDLARTVCARHGLVAPKSAVKAAGDSLTAALVLHEIAE